MRYILTLLAGFAVGMIVGWTGDKPWNGIVLWFLALAGLVAGAWIQTWGDREKYAGRITALQARIMDLEHEQRLAQSGTTVLGTLKEDGDH